MSSVANKLAKKCSRCQKLQPALFYASNKSTADGLQDYCRKCMSDYKKIWRERNREKSRAQSRASWRMRKQKNPDGVRRNNRETSKRYRVNSVKNLTNHYMMRLMKNRLKTRTLLFECPNEIIEAMREYLRLRRILKEKSNDNQNT